MEQLSLKDQCVEVYERWKKHKKQRREEIKKSSAHKGWLELMDPSFGRLMLGCMILLLAIPLLYPSSRYIQTNPGSNADLVWIILAAWFFIGFAFLFSAGLSDVSNFFFRWGKELFTAAGDTYDRDRLFVETLANDVRLEVSAIGRRVKGQLEVPEKFSALLTLIAGGASFYSVGQIAEALMKGHSLWLFPPALALAAATILVSNLLIGISLKGDLLICLEEADELRKKSNR